VVDFEEVGFEGRGSDSVYATMIKFLPFSQERRYVPFCSI